MHDIHSELDVISSRKKSRVITLGILVKEIRQLDTEIEATQTNIKRLRKLLNEIDHKRTKLNTMNFASSNHLKQTHKRYWNSTQQLIQQINQATSRMSNMKTNRYERLTRLNTLRSEIKKLIEQENAIHALIFSQTSRGSEAIASI